MKYLIIILINCLTCFVSVAQVYVDGYYRSNGTYVEPHYRSSPDGNPYNNYSYPGNYNPYTGKIAGGSEEAYLRNYYKAYASNGGSSYSGTTSHLDNYNNNLLGVNYWRIKGKQVEVIYNNAGINTGYIKKSLDNDNKYFIYDLNDVKIGKLEFRRSTYAMYDSYGMKLYAVKLDGSIVRPNHTAATLAYLSIGVIAGILLALI